MRQRNMVYTGPMIDLETEHAVLHPEPCLIPYNNHGPLPSGITFIAGPPGPPRVVPFMSHNQLPFPNHHAIEEAHNAFKGKVNEGFHVNFHYSYPAPPASTPFIGPEYQRFDVIPVAAMVRGVHIGAIDLNTGLQFMPVNHGVLPQQLQLVPGPWLEQQFSGSAPGIPYMQGYTNGNLVPFVHSLPPAMPPLPPVPRFVWPTQPIGVRVFQPHGNELILESNSRQRGLPHLRILPEDGVAMLDFANYGHRVDHHRDMRLDIDHMSYEELLALGEQIGNAGSGLSEDFILGHLKTRIFISSRLEDLSSADSAHQDLTLCTICQMDYNDQEKIGILDCNHEYHVDCIEKWLVEKNSCPVCKCTGLATKGKESGNLKEET